jgi:hypothetical protein
LSRLGAAFALTLMSMSQHAVAQPTLSEEDEARAAQLYRTGLRYYDVSDYAHAIEAFKASYVLTEAPELLFDIAQALRQSGPAQCQEAITFYRRYQAVEQDAKKRARADTLIAQMPRCESGGNSIAVPQPVEPATPAAPASVAPTTAPANTALSTSTAPSNEDSHANRPWVPIGLAIAGGLASATGGALWVWAHLDYNTLKATGCAPGCSPSLVSTLSNRELSGQITLAVGAAAAAIGVALWIWRPAFGQRVTVGIAPSLDGVALGGTF